MLVKQGVRFDQRHEPRTVPADPERPGWKPDEPRIVDNHWHGLQEALGVLPNTQFEIHRRLVDQAQETFVLCPKNAPRLLFAFVKVDVKTPVLILIVQVRLRRRLDKRHRTLDLSFLCLYATIDLFWDQDR